MTINDLIVGQLTRNLEILKMTVADFTDADFLVRPAPKANHAAWQIGHLVCAETGMISAIKPGAMPELPAGFTDKFSAKTSSVDDPKLLATKDQLMALLSAARAGTIAWVKTLTPGDLAAPGPERMRKFAPTVADAAIGMGGHTTMHIGQLQVIRRKLGKPILF